MFEFNLIKTFSYLRRTTTPSLRVYPTIARLYNSQADSNERNYEKKLYESRSQNEPIDMKRSRLLYQSRKRGTLENDLLLATFAKKYLHSMSAQELDMYDRLINTTSNEWDIYYWAVGTKEVPTEHQNQIMDKLVQHARNEDREQRFRQPSL